MKKLGAVIATLLVLSCGCKGQGSDKGSDGGADAGGKVRLLGSSTVTPLAGPLADVYG
jgi:ABC-type phosphate transport system substrate-binding protein